MSENPNKDVRFHYHSDESTLSTIIGWDDYTELEAPVHEKLLIEQNIPYSKTFVEKKQDGNL